MSTNVNRYILKLALAAALAYAVGNAFHSRRMTYVLYGSILCMHPIVGDTVGYVLDKLKSAALGATLGIMLDTAFEGNVYATLGIGLPVLLTGGYWFGVPKRVLIFSGIVLIMATSNPTYLNQSTNYIGLRFWNIFLGSAVGMAVNIALWPNSDKDKLDPAFARAIASIHELYDQVIDDYQQDHLAANAPSRKQMRLDIVQQLNAIDSLLGNAKNELWSPFTNTAPYEHWMALQTRVKSLFWLVADIGLALEGGDGDRLYLIMQAELDPLMQETGATFEYFSQPAALRTSQAPVNFLANLPGLKTAIRARLLQIETDPHRPADLDPSEIKRLSAAIYGLSGIASE
ncbi:MAG: FUSC family protein, partial [Waterburya sp.]